MQHPAHAELVPEFLADLAALPSASRLEDADVENIYALAYQLLLQGHYENAGKHFALLTLYRPTATKFLAGAALCHKMLQRYEAAIGVYAFMCMIEPAEPEHQLGIAECLLLQGQAQEARDTLALVVRFCAENPGHELAAQRAKAIAARLSTQAADAA